MPEIPQHILEQLEQDGEATTGRIAALSTHIASQRALITELVEALEEAWDIMKHGPARSGHIEAAESRATAAFTRAKQFTEQQS